MKKKLEWVVTYLPLLCFEEEAEEGLIYEADVFIDSSRRSDINYSSLERVCVHHIIHQKEGAAMSEEERSTKQPAVDLLSGDGSEEAAMLTDADEAKKFSIDDDEDVDKLEGKIYQDIDELFPLQIFHHHSSLTQHKMK